MVVAKYLKPWHGKGDSYRNGQTFPSNRRFVYQMANVQINLWLSRITCVLKYLQKLPYHN
jgi:hypothetical protein